MVEISPLSREHEEPATGILARAYVTNPLHIVAFGSGNLDANAAFFRAGLSKMKGRKLVATDGGRVVGVAHWASSPACRYSVLEKLGVMPALLRGCGLRSALRVATWLSTWAAHDPDELHTHLGPIAVDPESQGRGIGTRLMDAHCRELDREGAMGFLETDRLRNVEFYERFGFRATETDTTLGVETFFMRRGG